VLYDGTNTWTPNSGINYNNLTPTDPNIIAAAAWNATDAMGKTIRTQVAQNQIQIFTIGYSGNGGTDTGLLNRLSNTPLSTSYVAAEPSGRFYLVNNTAQLLPAFDAIASSILRLAY
jgi:cysteine synthase